MKIVVENKIPFLRGRLEHLGEVVYLPPEQITAETVADADAIAVRTRTICDRALLGDSRVRLVATATIGTDHIDRQWCAHQGIKVVNAPGCNAPAVGQWVDAALSVLFPDGVEGKTLGVVGVGHVGSIVAEGAKRRGMRVLLCDPPRAAAEGPEGFVDMEMIAREADAVTFHTPLDETTRHLCGKKFLDSCRRKPVILNAARGAVVDTPALIRALKTGAVSGVAIDCWEGEPQINRDLMQMCAVATPHIAGYSVEGKQRASDAVVAAMEGRQAPQAPGTPQAYTPYDILRDTRDFKANPGDMERLRNNYPLRHE